jgi:hypothetical protein
MLFYTFCVDIGKHNQVELSKAFNMLISSIRKHIKSYKLICFTNFEIKDMSKNYSIEFREYYDNSKIKLYSDKWLNLSFNKINIYKDLYDEFHEDFIWVDLDTIICCDISYINNLKNVFIEIGGNCINQNLLFHNNNQLTVPRNKYIQGNFWKLDINLYNLLMITLEEIINKSLILRYDLQDLFSYHIYIKNKGQIDNINILGNNVKSNTINGLSIWSKSGNTHATLDGFNNLYIDQGIIKSKFYTDKEIHILSFTFETLKHLYNNENFYSLFE